MEDSQARTMREGLTVGVGGDRVGLSNAGKGGTTVAENNKF